MSQASRTTIAIAQEPAALRDELIRDVRAGFAENPKRLPPKYFYDVPGSEIFEAITDLPEYYVTRAETAALARVCDGHLSAGRFQNVSEIGSGSSAKTRQVLETCLGESSSLTYRALDISGSALTAAAEELTGTYSWLTVHGIVGDFFGTALDQLLACSGSNLVLFLGSTLGNLTVHERHEFLRRVGNALKVEDRLLVGVDLQKDAKVIYPAYNDAAGVTAEFNLNVIRVLQAHLGASVTPEDFRHDAPYVESESRVEMRLYAQHDLEISWGLEGLPVYHMAAGEYILTEISCKFTRSLLEAELQASGLKLEQWTTDPDGLVAVAMVAPVQSPEA